MYSPAIIFLCVIVFFLGAGTGAIIERLSNKKPKSGAAVPDAPTMVVNKNARDGDVEVFSAWRTRNNQAWLEMDGQRIETKEALMPDQHQRLLGMVLELRPWLETARTGNAAQPVRQAQPDMSKVAQPVPVASSRGTPTGEESKPALPALESMIEQINKVLQSKLANSAFKERGIWLTEGPGGSVIIKDGLNRYEGIDSIPDPEVKNLIQQAVSDWEKGSK
jgi:hypothetical protein